MTEYSSVFGPQILIFFFETFNYKTYFILSFLNSRKVKNQVMTKKSRKYHAPVF